MHSVNFVKFCSSAWYFALHLKIFREIEMGAKENGLQPKLITLCLTLVLLLFFFVPWLEEVFLLLKIDIAKI